MNWKKVSVWSGLGGVLFGTAVYALKKSSPKKQLYAQSIPKGIKRLFIELEPVAQAGQKDAYQQRCYACEPTSFYVWSVLPSSRVAGQTGRGVLISQTQGTQVFFVVPTLREWQGDVREHVDPGQVGEAFYATLRIFSDARQAPLVSQIARDYPVEFHKCRVGGGPNGIETGEILVTPQPVAEYRFDMDGG